MKNTTLLIWLLAGLVVCGYGAPQAAVGVVTVWLWVAILQAEHETLPTGSLFSILFGKRPPSES